MADEKLSFVIDSNLDKIAQSVQTLTGNVERLYQAFRKKNDALLVQNRLEASTDEGVNALNRDYQTLQGSIGQTSARSREYNDITGQSEEKFKKISGSLSNLNDNFYKIGDTIKISGENWTKIGPGSWSMNNPELEKQFEDRRKKIRKVELAIQNSIKKMLDGVQSVGVRLAAEATNLKPFAMEFASAFSINPLKFFGFGNAMKEAFQLMLKFQQMRHELAYLSDASGDASKALSLVYEVAGGSAVASGTATGILRALADQGVITNKELKSIGILAGDLQAATGIAASEWASFTGELAFTYGVPEQGLKNITSALIGTNLRGAQLQKTMQSVNKILATTGFISGKPSTDSIHKLTKAVGGAVKQFQAMGISAEKATGFIEGLMDPENFEKNAFLFGKLGISASEYAGYLNDANGQQKLLQKTMSNLPQLAGEISKIQNPFARLQFAKTIGLDMQIVQNMAGKTKQEIEQMLADYEKNNKADEALKEKKKKMAAEAAKFDDMMLGLKMQVLGPVMKFLNGGMLKKFIGILPNIAVTIGSIFEAITPIIQTITDALMALTPAFVMIVEDFVNPFIKIFPQFLKSVLNLLPGADMDKQSVNMKGASPESNALFSGIKNLVSYMSKIYMILLGWKALNFIGDSFNKVMGFFKPGRKRLMDATLDEAANAFNRTPMKGGGLKDLGLGTKILGIIAMIFAAGKLFKFTKEAIFGKSESENLKQEAKVKPDNIEIKNRREREFMLNTDEMAERQGQRTGSILASKTFGIGKGNQFGLQRQLGVRNLLKPTDFSSAIPGVEAPLPIKPPSDKIIKSVSTLKKTTGFLKVLGKAMGPLSLGLTAFQVMTAENNEQRAGAIGGAIGGAVGAAFGSALGPVGTVLGGMVGGFIGDIAGSAVGRVIDMYSETNVTAEKRGQMAQDSLSKNMKGIFDAFKIGRFDLITKQLGLAFENLYLQLKQKVVRIMTLGIAGNDSAEGQNAATTILDRFQKQTANITDEAAMKTYFEQAKKQIEEIEGNSTVGNQMYINMLETQMESQKLQAVVAQEALKEQKKGNKINEQIRDKDVTPVVGVQGFVQTSGEQLSFYSS